MKESDFNAEVVRSLKAHNGWAYKLGDIPASITAGLNFVPEKPCDILGGYKGKFVAIEGKQFKKFQAFNINHLRPSQIKAMKEMTAAGLRGFIFLNIRIKAIKGEQSHENRVIIFDWKEWGQRIEENSIKQKELMALPFISGKTVKDKGIIYDLETFLEGL